MLVEGDIGSRLSWVDEPDAFSQPRRSPCLVYVAAAIASMASTASSTSGGCAMGYAAHGERPVQAHQNLVSPSHQTGNLHGSR
jgi:hypothetical protein